MNMDIRQAHMTPIERQIFNITGHFGECQWRVNDYLCDILSDYEYASDLVRLELIHQIDQQYPHQVPIDFKNYSYDYFIQVIEDEICATQDAIEKETLRTHPEFNPDNHPITEEDHVASKKMEIFMIDTLFKNWSLDYHLKRFEGKYKGLPYHL